MKRQIISLTIAISTVILTALPGAANTVKNIALRQIDGVKYKAVKVENSIDAMLNPEQGGVRPMPPPPPWIPPVPEDMMNKMPPSYIRTKPNYGNYTPMRNLPPSPPWITPTMKKNDDRMMNIPPLPLPIR